MGRARAGVAKAGITLDAGALIALDRGDKRMIALLRRALEQGCTFRVDLPPFLRQTVKTQNSLNGELSHGIVS